MAIFDIDQPADVRAAIKYMTGLGDSISTSVGSAVKATVNAAEGVHSPQISGALSAFMSMHAKPYGYLKAMPGIIGNGAEAAVKAYEVGDNKMYTEASRAKFLTDVTKYLEGISQVEDPFAPPRLPNGKPVP